MSTSLAAGSRSTLSSGSWPSWRLESTASANPRVRSLLWQGSHFRLSPRWDRLVLSSSSTTPTTLRPRQYLPYSRLVAIDQKKTRLLVICRQNLAALGYRREQAGSIRSIARREFCKEIRLSGGLRLEPSIESVLPAFIASMRSPGKASARVDQGSGDLGEAGTESEKLWSSITNLMSPWTSGPGVEKCRLGGDPGWSQRTRMQTQSPGLLVSWAQPCAVRYCSSGIFASVHWA
jgi:hypothetical protein